MAQRSDRQRAEGRPALGQHRVVDRQVPGRGQLGRRVQLVAVVRMPVGGVPVALEVDGRQAQRPRGEQLGDLDHALVDPQDLGEGGHPGGDVGGQRPQHQRRQEGDLHTPGAEREVPGTQHLGQLVHAHRLEVGQVDVVVGHRREQRLEQHPLQVGEPAGRSHHRGDAAGRRGHLGGVGPGQLRFAGPGQWHDHDAASYRRPARLRCARQPSGPSKR